MLFAKYKQDHDRVIGSNSLHGGMTYRC